MRSRKMVTRNHGAAATAAPEPRHTERSSHDGNHDHHHPGPRRRDCGLETVTFDFYRDIHKGIRNELFAVTHAAGTVDPGNAEAIAAVATRWRNLSGMLVTHADHEEVYVQPVVEEHAPHLAGRDHPRPP